MPSPTQKIRLTYEDFLLFPEDGKRHELIDGEHVVTPSPVTRHQKISGNLFFHLKDYVRRARAGEIFAAPMDVVLSPTDVVEPDLLFISGARAAIITEKNIQGAPDLVVEIFSKTTRKTDTTVKLKLYERFCVPEYWMVDSDLATVVIYRMGAQEYVKAVEYSLKSKDTLTSSLLPGFQLALSELFA